MTTGKTVIKGFEISHIQKENYLPSEVYYLLKCNQHQRIHELLTSKKISTGAFRLSLEYLSSILRLRQSFSSYKKKTIGLISHSASVNIYGGERSYIDMARGLCEAGFKIISFLPQSANTKLIDELSLYCQSVYVFKYSQDRFKADFDLHSSIFEIIAISEGIEIFYANTITLSKICTNLKSAGFPVAVHVRELPLEDTYLCEAFGVAAKQLVQNTISSANLLICNSRYTLSQFTTDQCITSIVHNVTLDKDLETIALQKLECMKADTAKSVSIISSNIEKKGIRDFYLIANQLKDTLPDVRFNIYGPITDFLKEVDRELRSPNIEIRGYVQAPSQALRHTDILVSLSHFAESFGRTALEAITAGVPVVAYEYGAIPEIIIHNQTGLLVPYKNYTKAAEMLEKLIKDKELFQSLSRNCLNHSKTFSFKDYIRKLNNLLSRITPEHDRYIFKGDDRIMPRTSKKAAKGNKGLIVGYFLWHFPVPSETFVINEIEELISRNICVHVFCKGSPYKDFKLPFDVNIHTVKDEKELATMLISENISIVHSHFVFPTVTNMVWPACEESKVPFTVIAHAQDIFKYESIEKNQLSKLSKSRFCKKVFAPSAFHYDYLLDQGVPDSKLARLPNSIKVDDYINTASKIKTNRNKDAFKVVAINRFVEKKGVENLLLAYKYLPQNISLNIYGYGELEDHYRQIITEHGIVNVRLCGGIHGRNQLAAVLSDSDLFVAPYIRASNGDMDGIPTIIMEALAAGTIVLASPISGIPDIIISGFNGFLCQPKPHEIADKILSISRMSKKDLESISFNGLALVKDKFNVSHCIDKLLRIWAEDEVDLAIVTWNNIIETPEVIRRVHMYTDSPYHLIICDNNSSSLAKLHLAELYRESPANTSIIFGSANSFVGPGTNKCIELGAGRVVVYICGKEGFIFDHGWEDSLIEKIDKQPNQIGLVGTTCYSPTYFYAKNYKEIPLYNFFRGKDFLESNPNQPMVHIQGGFFAINRDMYDQIGGFSDSVPHNYTDVEYSLYAQSLGWQFAQSDRLIALFNKTKPGIFGRINSKTRAMHPPRIDDLSKIEQLRKGEQVICNICERTESKPILSNFSCQYCGSSGNDRLLFHYLSTSPYLYRRLPALIIDDFSGPMLKIFKDQFQGRLLTSDKYLNMIEDNNGFLDNPSNRFELIIIRVKIPLTKSNHISELCRVLAPGGKTLLVGENSYIQNFDSWAMKFNLSCEVYSCSDFVFRPSNDKIQIITKRSKQSND
ncbi:glycosyltransferase [Microcystis elabens FACHB-917]|nr:glycosyltransferase [Microcystis elabens FACHB-917]